MKTFFSKVFVVSVFSVLAGSFLLSSPDVIVDENRKITEFPQFNIKKSFKRYFSRIDRFAIDHFPFRQELIRGYSEMMNVSGGGQVAEEKALRGKDGWLFLGNYTDQAIEKLEGRMDPNVTKPQTAFGVLQLAHWFQGQGVNVVFLLGPNKSSIYPEYLPSIIQPSSRRYAERSLEVLRQYGIPVLDPTAELLQRKKTDIVYWKRDTHWNQIGASVAFEQIMDYMKIRNCPAYEFELMDDFENSDLARIASLGSTTKRMNDNFRVLWADADSISHRNVDYPGIKPGESIKFYFYENLDAAQKSTIWFIGDSFSGHLLPFSAHCFSRTGFSDFNANAYENLKKTYAESEFKPTYVIIELVERKF